jgi:capsular exopolysaccharide synthesis family protein
MNIGLSSSPLKLELGPELEPEPQAEVRSPLRVYVSHVWRQRWVISASIVTGIILCGLALNTLKPTYRASTLLLLEGQEQKTIEAPSVVPLAPRDLETVNAEITLIKSRPFAEKIIDSLKLENHPEFAPGDENPTVAWLVMDWVKLRFGQLMDTVHSNLGLAAEEDLVISAASAEAKRRETLIDAYLKRLEARPAGQSRLIEVAFTSQDAQLSATVANTLTDYYISEQMRSKVEVTERTAKWLDERLLTLRSEAEKSERQAEQFRTKSGLMRGEEGPLIIQEMTKLNTELSTARVARAEAEARLQQAEQAISGGRGVTAEVLRSPMIQELTRQAIALKQQETNLLKTMGDKHPSVQAIRAQMEDMQSAIGQETRSLLSGLRSEAAAARAREKMLSDQVTSLKNQTATLSQAEVQLRSYSANVDASRALLGQLQTRLNEVVLQRDILQPDTRVLAAATVPTMPNGPSKALLLILATFFSGVIGLVIGMTREALDSKVRSADQLTAASGVPMLGIVPRLPGRWRRCSAASRYMAEHPASAYSESINAILAAHLLHSGRGSTVVTVSSSLPGEGKSLFSLSLARAASHLKKRVLLIEADMRRPSLHEFIGMKPPHGLSDVLTGQVPLEDAIHDDPQTELQVLSCGTPIRNPLPLIGSRDFVRMLQTARRSFDLIIIDGPPLLPVPDGRILAANADETIFIAAWGQTPVTQALQALHILKTSGANVRAIIVSQVDVRRHAEYNYSDSGQYHLGQAYYRN